MTSRLFRGVIALGLFGMCGACRPEGNPPKQVPAAASSPVILITDEITPLSFADVELTLAIVSRDERDLPKEIAVTFRNNSSARGCLALPRPVVEDHDYRSSLPCLVVGMRKLSQSLSPTEPIFLYAIPHTDSAGLLEGIYLEQGATLTRQYKLASFCLIGHGIGPKPEANFLTCYEGGNLEYELRAYVITDWKTFQRHDSNPLAVRASEFDFQVRGNLGD